MCGGGGGGAENVLKPKTEEGGGGPLKDVRHSTEPWVGSGWSS